MKSRGIEDSIYVNFFGFDGKAAMLACDMYGILPENLLYMPKAMFAQTGNEEEHVILIRYTMCERSRQGTFRTLLGAKLKLMQKGNVEELWEERTRVLPDAAPCPRFTDKQLENAAATLDTDTESDDELKIDERGMMKPPPPVPATAPHIGSASTDDVVVGGGDLAQAHKAGVPNSPASPGLAEKPLSPFAVPRPYVEGVSITGSKTASATTSPVSKGKDKFSAFEEEGTEHQSEEVRSYKLLELIAYRPKPKAALLPPTIPQPYFPRTHEALSEEEKELATTEKKLSRYSKRAVRRVKKRRNRMAQVTPAAEADTTFPPLSSSHNLFTTEHFLELVELQNHREMAAIHRVAKVDLTSMSKRYERARAIDEEMEGIPALGTLEHMLKYNKSIGVTLEFKDRLQSDREQQESLAALERGWRKMQSDRENAIEQKQQHAQKVFEREREKAISIFAEVQRTHEMITSCKKEAAFRQRKAKMSKIYHQNAVREARADKFMEGRRRALSMLRYTHDQQELHRRELRRTVLDIKIRKNFEATKLID